MGIKGAAVDLLACFRAIERQMDCCFIDAAFMEKFNRAMAELKAPTPPQTVGAIPVTVPTDPSVEGYHWLHSERSSTASVAQWIGKEWHLIGESNPISPEEMRRRGWEYLSPVIGRGPSKYLDR